MVLKPYNKYTKFWIIENKYQKKGLENYQERSDRYLMHSLTKKKLYTHKCMMPFRINATLTSNKFDECSVLWTSRLFSVYPTIIGVGCDQIQDLTSVHKPAKRFGLSRLDVQ